MPKKDPYADLDDEFKEEMARLTREDIRARIAEISIAQVELMKAKEDDHDLASAKEVAKEAGAVYREGTKLNKLRINFAKQVLDDKGG